ncbi:MAG: hypothetical protein ACWGOV_03970 [Acidiferrobacterales bacterium]
MSQHATKLLKNLNGSFLFFFLVIFTAPLDADEVISGNLGDDRRRAHAGSVVVNIISHGEMSTARTDAAKDSATQDLLSHSDATTHYSAQDNNYTDVASADQHLQQAFWCLQCDKDLFQAELDQSGSDTFNKRESEPQSRNTPWIGTVISETGPPPFPENPPSHLFGHDNNGRLPQVAIIEIPDIVSQNVFHQIDSKILSVRSPTGPPYSLETTNTSRNRQSGSNSSPSNSHLDPSIRLQTYSRGMQVMLRGAPVRMST